MHSPSGFYHRLFLMLLVVDAKVEVQSIAALVGVLRMDREKMTRKAGSVMV